MPRKAIPAPGEVISTAKAGPDAKLLRIKAEFFADREKLEGGAA